MKELYRHNNLYKLYINKNIWGVRMEGEYIDIRQLCRWLALKQPTAYKLAESGQIPSYKIGKLRRFRVSEVRKWLEDCKA
jgi:excisionase family DNA binding protein